MDAAATFPTIIQGGMGVAVSNWRLANAVSRRGQLGVVSGSMLDTVLVRRLQDGDPGGDIRRAMAHFPIPRAADEVLRRFYLARGRAAGRPYKLLPMYRQTVTAARQRVTMLANFVEVWLAKEGHDGVVGLNLLSKVQMPNLASLYGAMLAGVDYVLMGAGIPREIPGVLDAFAAHHPARIRFDVEGGGRADAFLELAPAEYWPADAPPRAPLRRPRFLAIVSAASLAMTLARKSTGQVDGFVIESPTAGGHNAPPRGELRLTASGEPIYGERDEVDLEAIRALGRPFWLAGGFGTADGLGRARAARAAGIQVGTLFAYCEESGIAPAVRQRVIDGVLAGEARVITDPVASPTRYPFKLVEMSGDRARAAQRTRICDLGYLRTAVQTPAGVVYRCPAEPVDAYVAKGGSLEDTAGRRCLCNGLTATVGQPQSRGPGEAEEPLVTAGDDLLVLHRFLGSRRTYGVADVIEYLLNGLSSMATPPS